MTSEELRGSINRAVAGAMSTPPSMDPFVMDEELRAAASSDLGGHHGFPTGGEGGEVPLPKPFDPMLDDDGVLIGVSEGYYQIGGFTYKCNGMTDFLSQTGTIFICLIVDSMEKTANCDAYTESELKTKQEDLSKLIIPLYKTEDYKIVMDLRNMPNGGMLEDFTLY